jgi:hypothetical protein
MQESGVDSPSPQFGTVEYAGTAGTDQCEFCHQSLVGRYYRVNNAMACSSCADRAQRQVPKNGHGAYARALLFGVAAAVVGLILYAAFGIITGWMIGYVSLAVGYIVGKAMMKGSKGRGGRRYQVTAVLLTYAAVSMAAIPIGLAQYAKKVKLEKQQAHVQQTAPATAENSQADQAKAKPDIGIGKALVYLALLGLTSPFLELQDPLHGIIGLIILLVGIQIAWKTTAGKPTVEVTGPFDLSPAFENSAPASV